MENLFTQKWEVKEGPEEITHSQENQFLAYSEEEGGELTLHEEGKELECFPEDSTKNQ